MHDTTVAHDHGRAQYYWVWGGLLILTAIEVWLAYMQLALATMLALLLGLSVAKAALIIGYFMHLKFETRRMKWVLMSALVICLLLMSAFFPDALRLLRFGVR